MANPQRDLPVVITSAMVIVISGFCMMNAAIYVVLPFETIRTSTTVAVVRLPSIPTLASSTHYRHTPQGEIHPGPPTRAVKYHVLQTKMMLYRNLRARL